MMERINWLFQFNLRYIKANLSATAFNLCFSLQEWLKSHPKYGDPSKVYSFVERLTLSRAKDYESYEDFVEALSYMTPPVEVEKEEFVSEVLKSPKVKRFRGDGYSKINE